MFGSRPESIPVEVDATAMCGGTNENPPTRRKETRTKGSHHLAKFMGTPTD